MRSMVTLYSAPGTTYHPTQHEDLSRLPDGRVVVRDSTLEPEDFTEGETRIA